MCYFRQFINTWYVWVPSLGLVWDYCKRNIRGSFGPEPVEIVCWYSPRNKTKNLTLCPTPIHRTCSNYVSKGIISLLLPLYQNKNRTYYLLSNGVLYSNAHNCLVHMAAVSSRNKYSYTEESKPAENFDGVQHCNQRTPYPTLANY